MSLCRCGCGQKTFVPDYNWAARGYKKGSPVAFAKGHNMKTKPEYLVEDRGFKTPCWIWNRAIYRHGYGQARVGNRVMGAHRMMWIRFKGSIPEGATLDHLCRSRLCVNPKHLQVVPGMVNSYRGGQRAAKNCCKCCGRPF